MQPGSSRLAAHGLCISAMREILEHFLGESLPRDVVVHEVTRITSAGVFGERVDASTIAEVVSPSPSEEVDSGPSPPPSRWTPFVATDGRAVRVSCGFEPVYRLKPSQLIGYRLVRCVLHMPSDQPFTPSERRNLSRADLEHVDFATLARGLDRLRVTAEGDRQPTLILPVTYTTLSNLGAREALLRFFKSAQGMVRHGLICEVCDFDGVPPSALLAASSVVRSHCLFTVGQLGAAPQGRLDGLREAGFRALSVECPPLSDDAEFVSWARALVRATRAATHSVIAYRLNSLRHAALAGELGVTHASLAKHLRRSPLRKTICPPNNTELFADGTPRSTSWLSSP